MLPQGAGARSTEGPAEETCSARVSVRYCKSNESESRALFSLKYHRAFERFFAVLACWRVGATIRQVKRKFTRLIKKSRKQMFEQPKYRRKFTSRNGISASFPTAR